MDRCPQCGYVEVKQTKPVSHHMNVYVVKETGKVDGAYNADAEEMTVKGVVLSRKDLWKAPAVKPPGK